MANETNITDTEFPLWCSSIYMALGVTGIIDNGFTILVILSSKAMREKTTNKMISNQSALDWVASALLIAYAATLMQDYNLGPKAGPIWCRGWMSTYPVWSILSASSFNLVGITLERYYGIVKPVRYRSLITPRRAKIAMAVVWIAGCIVTLPNFGTQSYNSETRSCDNVQFPLSGVMSFSATFFAPIITMLYCYVKMILTCRTKVKPGQNLSISEKKRMERIQQVTRNIVKTLIVVGVAFILCWALNQSLYIAYHTKLISDANFTNKDFYLLSTLFTFAHCCINPFIYTFQYHDFQVALKQLLGRNDSVVNHENEASETPSKTSNMHEDI